MPDPIGIAPAPAHWVRLTAQYSKAAWQRIPRPSGCTPSRGCGDRRYGFGLCPDWQVPGSYGRAWRMRFMGVRAARRNRLYPACSNTSRSRASPAWAPRPSATSWDSELGVQMAEDAV
jgi:hypothetical protein